MDGCMEAWMDEWMEIDGWMHGGMDGNRWMDA